MSPLLSYCLRVIMECVLGWGLGGEGIGARYLPAGQPDACWDIDSSSLSDRLIIVMVITQILRK